MFITTTMLALHIPFVKNLHWTLGVAFLLIFGFFDGTYQLELLVQSLASVLTWFISGLFVGAAVKKVPHGAWFPLAIGTVLCVWFLSGELPSR